MFNFVLGLYIVRLTISPSVCLSIYDVVRLFLFTCYKKFMMIKAEYKVYRYALQCFIEALKHDRQLPNARYTTLCLKKFPTFILSVTLSNLNRCSHFCIAGKRMKFATEPIQHYPLHLMHVATLPREIKNSNFWLPVNCACVPQRF